MWLGLMHYDGAEDGLDGERVILVAYEPHRLFSVGAPASATPLFVRMLREASDGGTHVRPPRCGRCAAPLEVPPLECASA